MATNNNSCITTRRVKVEVRVDDVNKRKWIAFIAKLILQELPIKDGTCEVEICLSGDQHSERNPKPAHPEAMMRKLYDDTVYRDVSFLFDGGTEVSMDPGRALDGAHKLVLAQWPYFKTMFESEFSDGGEGPKQIRIKDTKAATFKRAIQFMYMGVLAKDDQPTTVFIDALENEEDVSWEDVYVVAHRYDLEGLCQLAKESIISGLTTENAVPFLFRSAYLYDELRESVVKYAATSCASTIASKDFRSKYLGHPEIATLLHELFVEQSRSK
ncbi:hypothetical protein CPB97_002364 [Podila verticillata]|nr:hypothetical protein CPB97_002364 [Podila verticillata]